MRSKPKVTVLLTSHNRRDNTRAAAAALEAANDGSANLEVVLVDAGSTDGTVDAVRAVAPSVKILHRSDDVYWNAGMREAWYYALTLTPLADFYLWLNDDLQLTPRAIRKLLAEYDAESRVSGTKIIVVGRTTAPGTDQTTYGGYVRASRISRVSWRHLKDGERYCDTMNGNCVLVPSRAVSDVGIFSDRFQHAAGDLDYGLRAKAAGYRIVECRDPVGSQDMNAKTIYSGATMKRFDLKTLGHAVTSPKGLPFGETLYFMRRHAGPLWPVNFVLRYVKLFVSFRKPST